MPQHATTTATATLPRTATDMHGRKIDVGDWIVTLGRVTSILPGGYVLADFGADGESAVPDDVAGGDNLVRADLVERMA